MLIFHTSASYSFWGDGGAGWAQIPYLVKILAENIKRYQQLKSMVDTARNRDQYIRLINSGLENSLGLLNSLPIIDERILSEIHNFQKAFNTVTKVYGAIPKSDEAALHMLHDQSVAESIKMASNIKKYAQKQEENANRVSIQSRRASPKGAARMTAETNSKILHTLNQLLRINGQILKLQGENLAMNNKAGKDSVGHFNKINSDIKSNLKNFDGSMKLLKF
ncbi:MAG: hypothetical protein CME70_10980 [Halobacteriovorax sp.]|nr:hypothetical protein [Halobacteriovorax sp.]